MKAGELRRSALSNFIWGVAERIGARTVGLVITVILARILDPVHYSVISIASIFLTFCDIIVAGGLNSALIQKKNVDDLDYSTIFYYSISVSVLLYLIMFLAAPLIADIYETEMLIPALRVLSVRLLINALYSIESAYISRTMQFKKFFFATLVGTIVSAAVGIYMAYAGYGVWALIVQNLLNSIIDTIMLTITSGLKLSFKFSFSRLKHMFGFGNKMLIASFVSAAYDNIRPLIVGIKYQNEDLVYYSKGSSYPGIFYNITLQPLSSVLFPVMAKAQSDNNLMLNMLRRYMKTASFVIFPIMIGFYGISYDFVKILLTEKWIAIVPYMQVFCVVYMIDIINQGAIQCVKALGKGGLILKMEIMKKVVNFAIIFLFILFSNSPIWIAISCIICNCAGVLIHTFITRRLLKYNYKKQIMDIFPSLLIAIIMCACIFGISFFRFNIYLDIVLKVIIGVIAYTGFSFLFNRENFLYMASTIKMYINK